MSDIERQHADQLIKASTGKDGHVDNGQLRTAIIKFANDSVNHDPHVREMTEAGAVGPTKKVIIDRMNIAAREVMGLIPQNQWDHSSTADVLTNSLSAAAGIFKSEQSFPVFDCNQNGHAVGTVDAHQSLTSQGISCSVKPATQR